MKKRNVIFNVLVVLAFLLAGMETQTAKADGFIIVNTNLDDTTAGDGFCTLREAINNANENLDTTSDDCVEGSGADTVTFDSSLSGGTIILGSNLPTISDDLTVDGSAFASQLTLSGNNAYKSGFQIDNTSVIVSIMNLTFINGYQWGGAISNHGTLTITNSVFSNNHGNLGNGGAIISWGTLIVSDSIFSGNSTVSNGGGIANGGTLTLTNTTFYNNSAVLGGGLFNEGPASVGNATFSENTASGQVNTLNEGQGGGIYNIGTLTLNNATISNNAATNNGGGVFNHNNGTLNYLNTIIANSASGGDCWTSATPLGTNTHNLVEDGSCSASLSGDPKLDVLANNGGPTQILALLPGSPALNTGDDATCAATDQRGMTRPQRGHCDIGSFEYESVVPSVDSFTTPSIRQSGDIPITTFTASDDIAVIGYMVTESATPPSPNDSGWKASVPSQYTITREGGYFTDGIRTLYPWVKDADDNVSAAYSSPAILDLTFIPPYIVHTQRYPLTTSEITNADALSFVVSFWGGVKNVDPSDFVVTGGTTATVTSAPSFNSVTLVVTVSGGDLASFNGTLGLDISPTQDIVSTYTGKHLVASVPNPNETYTVDNTAPTVVSIVRASANPTSASTVDFTVTFSESVTGVDKGDFSLTTTGVTGASVTNVSGSGATRTVSAKTGNHGGTILLNVLDNDTVMDATSNLLGGGFTTGESYSIAKSNLHAPILRSPRTKTLVNSNLPTFWWNNVQGAQSYEIQFAENNSFTVNVGSEIVSGSSYGVTTPVSDGTYYWRVRAYDIGDLPGAWSSYRILTIDTTAPATPVLSSPADNSSARRSPIFRWEKDNTAVGYQFQLDDPSSFTSPNYSVIIRGNFRRLPATKPGTYYWRVRAKDAAGNWSPWSVYREFEITH